ncbi:hypothetical protein [Chromobacterium subtsugae]|uniref:hypothetical protein n=1 Tax=Chromobacterium subtsugae TaxID=251747 RepID=UPI0006417E6C|nr:hypothetical protein [Chromobacterium subtsugae]
MSEHATAVPGEEEEVGEQSLREQLQAAYTELNSAPNDPPPQPKPAEQQAAGQGEPKPGTARDQQGRFTAKQDGAPAAAAAAAAQPADKTAVAAPAADASAAQPAAATAPPASWSAEARPHWEKIPPEAQQYIATREAQMQQQFSRMDDERQTGRQFREALKPFEHTIRQFNVPPVVAAQHLFAADAALRYGNPAQKIDMVHQILRDYGIPLDAVAQYQPQQVDPAFAAMQQRLQQLEQMQLQGVQQQHEAQQADMQRQIEAFQQGKPHFEQVRGDMAVLLQSGMASSLDDAYERAVWARPDLRQNLISKHDADQREAAAQAASQRAQQAKAAGVSLSGAPGSATPAAANQNLSLRDELAQNLRAARGQV